MIAAGWLLQSVLKMSVVLTAAFVALSVMRRRSAALRHAVLSAAIVCAAIVPALEIVVPAWPIALPAEAFRSAKAFALQRRSARAFALQSALSERATSRLEREGFSRAPEGTLPDPQTREASVARVLVWTWLAGAFFGLVVLAAGFGRLVRIGARATSMTSAAWTEEAETLSHELGLRTPVALLHSNHPSLIVTWGWRRPRIVLPSSASEWTTERVRIVLAHEIAHVARGDWPLQLAAEIVRTIYWFNPLIWIACARLRQESEQATDDAVLGRGVAGDVYAEHLVALARTFAVKDHVWLPAPAIARPSSLERRIRAMLDDRTNRMPTTRRARLATLALLLAAAAAVAAAQSFSTFSGSMFDSMNGYLPNVTMTLTNVESNAKYEVRTDRNGHFEFVGLPPGSYTLAAELAGFTTLRATVEISGANVQRDMTMKIGSLQETVSVVNGDETAENWRKARPAKFQTSSCQTAPAAGGMGGNIRVPLKLVSVKPRYPATLGATRTTGVVVLDVRIGTDGAVREMHTVSSDHPDFEHAAREAVSQWEFTETLLNCVAVEVPMRVTVNFVAQ